MSKQKNSAPEDSSVIPQVPIAEILAATKERDYGPRPQDMQPVGISEAGILAGRKKTPRRAAPNIQLLAKIDRLLEEADEKKPGTALSILSFLAEERGAILEAQE